MQLLDESTAKRVGTDKGFHGLELDLRTFGGARAARVIHPGAQRIADHRHDWACITFHILGTATEEFEGGEISIDGPAAVFHPAGSWHNDRIGAGGLETVSVQFDPDWLGPRGLRLGARRSVAFRGGSIGAAARRLAASWTQSGISERRLIDETGRFFRSALAYQPSAPPGWVRELRGALNPRSSVSTSELAHRHGLTPIRLARSYRSAFGEGLQETLRRRRVEAATGLLRHTDLALAEVALDAGFCDQSHMNRSFRAVLGRTPLEVRREWAILWTA